MPRKQKNATGIPDYELDALARALLPAFQEFFSFEKNRKEYEEWLAERNKKKTAKTPK